MNEEELKELYNIGNELVELKDKLRRIVGRFADSEGYDAHLTEKGYELKRRDIWLENQIIRLQNEVREIKKTQEENKK
jgi:hypothetical protein